MALSIKNESVERLLEEVIRITGESKTEAVRRALEERRQRLALRSVGPRDDTGLRSFLQDEVWAIIPDEQRGKRLSKQATEELLGYGEHGI